MPKRTLTKGLWVAAGLLPLAGVLEIVLADTFLPQPFLGGAVLALLAVLSTRFPRPIAWLMLPLAVLVPIAAVLQWQRGEVVWLVPVFDLVVFVGLAVLAWPVARAEGETA